MAEPAPAPQPPIFNLLAAGFVGAFYWAIYRAAFGTSYPDEK
jgi:hypothetical protein